MIWLQHLCPLKDSSLHTIFHFQSITCHEERSFVVMTKCDVVDDVHLINHTTGLLTDIYILKFLTDQIAHFLEVMARTPRYKTAQWSLAPVAIPRNYENAAIPWPRSRMLVVYASRWAAAEPTGKRSEPNWPGSFPVCLKRTAVWYRFDLTYSRQGSVHWPLILHRWEWVQRWSWSWQWAASEGCRLGSASSCSERNTCGLGVIGS